MLSAFANTFRIPELRQRIFFTLWMVFICRVVSSVPSPGVDAAALQMVIEQAQSKVGGGDRKSVV